LEVERFSGIES